MKKFAYSLSYFDYVMIILDTNRRQMWGIEMYELTAIDFIRHNTILFCLVLYQSGLIENSKIEAKKKFTLYWGKLSASIKSTTLSIVQYRHSGTLGFRKSLLYASSSDRCFFMSFKVIIFDWMKTSETFLNLLSFILIFIYYVLFSDFLMFCDWTLSWLQKHTWGRNQRNK